MKKDAAAPTTPSVGEEQIYRLTDMIVEEVSAVDRAANKHTFLVVKSATGAVGAMVGEVVSSASGELTVAKAPEPTEPAQSVAAPVSPESPPIPSATNTEEAPLGTQLRLSPEHKAELAERMKNAAETLAKITAAVNGAEEVQGLAEVPQEVLDGFTSIASALSSGVTKAAVEKGRKQISMAREAMIRAAYDALAKLLAEVDAVEPTKTEPAVPAAVEPAPVAPAAPTAKVDKSRDIVLTRLVELVEKQSAAITKQAGRIDEVARTRPTSNARVVEATPIAVTKNESHSWPLDMNGRAPTDALEDFTSR